MIDFESIGIGESIHLPGSTWESGPQKLDMLPALTSNNPMALLRTDTVESAKLSEGDTSLRVSLADRKNSSISKLCANMVLAFYVRKPFARMKYVLPMSNPFKIFEMVIPWIKVYMVNLLSFIWRPNKATSNQLVYQNTDFHSVTVELDSKMPVFPFVWAKGFAASKANYFSKIGNSVEFFIARNRLPLFSHIKPLLVDSSVSVAWQLAQKPAFGSYPSQAGVI